MPMPLEIKVSYDDGSSLLYYIPNDLMHGLKSFDKENIYQISINDLDGNKERLIFD